jgi:ABC-type multidrug transport system ATPase subunit
MAKLSFDEYVAQDNKVSAADDLEANLENVSAPRRSEGLVIDFADLSYIVQEKKADKTILAGVSGMFMPGTLTALMGPSGSGKTTLLDVIAGRKSGGKITGRVCYNGKAATSAVLKQKVGYVEQFDTLIPELTVCQMLMYAAELKLSETTSLAEKKGKVEHVLNQLSLLECRDTVIGDALRKGISGGQAKRVNIGLALLTSPSVIFLDEPTTGKAIIIFEHWAVLCNEHPPMYARTGLSHGQ